MYYVFFGDRKALEKAKELAILVVGLAGGNLTTDTRFQKISFLVDQEVLGGEVKFEPMDFGPYSKELEKAVNELSKEGKLVRVDDSDGVTHYYLTKKGEEEFGRIKSYLGEEKLKRAESIVKKFRDAPLTYLLAYVYSKYQEYTVNSKITEKVEEWRKRYGI